MLCDLVRMNPVILFLALMRLIQNIELALAILEP